MLKKLSFALLGFVGFCCPLTAQFDTISPNLDQAFGANGFRRGTIPGSDFGTVVKKDPLTGGYYVAGTTLDDQGEDGVFLARYTPAGDPDPAFNTGMPLLLANLAWVGYFGTSNDWFDTPMGMAVQPDGKVVLCGHMPDTNGPATLFVRRFLPDGQVDTNFATGGVFFYLQQTIGTGVVIDGQGRLLCFGAARMTQQSEWNSSVLRLTPDGALDTSFNGSGVLTFDMDGANDTGDFLNCAAVLGNGDLLLIGYTGSVGGGGLDFYLGRLDPNGSWVSGFGTNGQVVHDMFGHFDWSMDLLVDETSDRAYVAVLADGDNAQHADMAIACAHVSDGSLDPSFGNAGKVQLDVGNNTGYNDDFLMALALDNNGSLFGGGSVTIDNQGFTGFLFRWNEQGQLQTNWLDNGTDTVCYVGEVQSILIDNDGLIVIGFQFDIPEILNGADAWQSADHFIARYGPNALTVGNPLASSETVLVAPNPSSGLTTIIPGPATELSRLDVFDATGRLIRTQPVANVFGPVTLDLSAQENGLYSVQVLFANGQRSVQRIIKQ